MVMSKLAGYRNGLYRHVLRGIALAGLALALSSSITAVAAAGQITFFPFAGYTTISEIDGSGSILPGTLKVAGAFTAGAAIGTTTPQNIGIEAMYTYQASGLIFKPTGAPEMDVTDMTIHQIHANFLFYMPGGLYAPTKPYFLVGLGANIFDPSDFEGKTYDSQTEFTWALGLGVKREVNEKVALRVQTRYTPTYLSTNQDGYWCDPYYGCYSVVDSNFLDQWDFTGGLVFNLGGR